MATNFMEKMLDNLQLKMDLIAASPMKKFLLESDSNKIGACVQRGMQVPEEWSLAATSVCKRRFQWFDIILMVALDEKEEGEAGIVFTEKGIYHWLEGDNFVAEVLYEDIDAIGYVNEYVILTRSDDSHVELFCGKGAVEEKYSRYMYNFIVDVVMFFDKEVLKT